MKHAETGTLRAYLDGQLDSGHPRHDYVGEDQIKVMRLGNFERLQCAVANRSFVARQAECARKRSQRVGFVIHYQKIGFLPH